MQEEDIKNMSKEELLEYLEEISQQLDNIALDQIQFAISELQFFKEEYKKLEEENKTLNERNQYLVKYRAKLEKELYESNENYIPVSLVEEKIEELKNKSGGNVFHIQQTINAEIRLLQELLEKRK